MFAIPGILFTLALSLYIYRKLTNPLGIKTTAALSIKKRIRMMLPAKRYIYQVYLMLKYALILVNAAFVVYLYRYINSDLIEVPDTIPNLFWVLVFPFWDGAATLAIEVVFLLKLTCEVLFEGFDSYVNNMFRLRHHLNPYSGVNEMLKLRINTASAQKNCHIRDTFCPKFWHDSAIDGNEPWNSTGKSYYLGDSPRLSPMFHNCYCSLPITISVA